MNHKSILGTALVGLALLPVVPTALTAAGVAGAVYTMDNSASANHILAFDRKASGELAAAGTYATGGVGSGGGLGNQGAVILSRDGRWLLACNAGSDDISVFRVTANGLEHASTTPSHGRRPISLTLHGNLVYVLNAGGAAGDRDSIAGFRLSQGELVPCPDSLFPLSAVDTGPAQIGFNNDGNFIVVTEKATQNIVVFTVNSEGGIDSGMSYPAAAPTPFGFAFSRHGQLVVTEAVGGMPDASVVSTYALSPDGELSGISTAIPTTETAACWAVVTRDGRFAYVSNTGSGSISGFAVQPTGEITLLQSSGVSGSTGSDSRPIDVAVSRDSRYLYSLNSGNGTLSAFRVNGHGSLQALPVTTGIPAGANGLAAR